MLIFMLIFFLNMTTLLTTLVTASRVPSRSASFTVGVALMACLAAGEQVIRQRSTPVAVVMTVGLNAVVLCRLVAVGRATRRTPPRLSAGLNEKRQENA